MDTGQRFSIWQAIGDAISILDTSPVAVGPIHQMPTYQITNRGPVAHQSMELGIKALVEDSGGTYNRNHNLWPNFQKLNDCDSYAAEFLEAAFDDAVQFYGFKPNAKGFFTHLKSIEAYLSTAGSERAFNAMRYRELEQPLDDEIINKVFILIHGELLRALEQLFISRTSLRTAVHRVENAVTEALVNDRWAELGYSPGSDKEVEVDSYLEWLKGFPNRRAALAEAKRQNFAIGNATANSALANAYQSLAQGNDPAVRYYLSTLDTLPPQQRNYIPEVEWLGPTECQRGVVKSPAGSPLGRIERRTDGLWNITPLVEGSGRVQETAESQTDARARLADLLTHPVAVAVGGNRREQRLVGEANRLLPQTGVWLRHAAWVSGEDVPTKSHTWELEFWYENHGLEVGDEVVVEFREAPSKLLMRVLKGTVLAVDRWKVSVSGRSYPM